MILGMYDNPGHTGNKDSFLKQWRQGRLAERRSAATTFLAVVLVLCLLAAQMMVEARAVKLRPWLKGAEIIKRVADEGLVNAIGTKTITRYYLLKSDDEEWSGYMVLVFEPQIRPDGLWVLTGRELEYHSRDNSLVQTGFTAADDLSWHNYHQTRQVTQDKNLVFTGHDYRVEQGILYSSYRIGQRKYQLNPIGIRESNLVPILLLDFFSSLAVKEGGEAGVVFSVVNPNLLAKGADELLDVLVQAGGAVPDDIINQSPRGHGVKAKWLEDTRRQILYYDQEHQLVWQKDLQEPSSTITAVTRAELVEKFREAEPLLRIWFRKETDRKDAELL